MKLIDWPMRQYIRGNFQAFGLWQGLKVNITLMSPLLNLLIHWKYRNSQLWFADENGKPLSALEVNALLNRVDKE